MPQNNISVTSAEVSNVLQPVPRNKKPPLLPIKPDESKKVSLASLEEKKGDAVINNIKAIQVAPSLKGFNIDKYV